MPWCPTCKNEYVEGMKVCADCGMELVESLEAVSEEIQEEEEMEGMDAILPQDSKNIPGYPMPEVRRVYQNSAKQAEENRMSAYMLLIIGGIGVVVMSLILVGIIPISVSMFNKYMICGVMGVLFILFIVMGFVSMKSSKALEKKAESENSLTSGIKLWCQENLTKENIDENLFDGMDEVSEEAKYFKRVEAIKARISNQFLNLDEEFLEAFIDEYYTEIFE